MAKVPFVLLFQLLTMVVSSQHISNYLPFTGWGIKSDATTEVIVLRKFTSDGQPCFLTVNPKSLNTTVFRTNSLLVHPAPWDSIQIRFAGTPYLKALKQAGMYGDSLQDAGFKRFLLTRKGINLTIDLCPSQRPLDLQVFTDLIHELGRVEKPVPVAISITGRWMNNHSGNLNWLDSLIKAGDLSIVWVNHTYSHYTSKTNPLKTNFMLTPGTNVNTEVLNTEVALLQRGLMPSVFFRFPGLVSDFSIYEQIIAFGLIPVGSDAWLAKGQMPVNGSIVLIHANGNEPLGVHQFIKLLKNKRSEVMSKRWELFDLRESLVEEESKTN